MEFYFINIQMNSLDSSNFMTMFWNKVDRKKWKLKLLSHIQLFVIPWTVAHQAPLPMEFSMLEYWSG